MIKIQKRSLIVNILLVIPIIVYFLVNCPALTKLLYITMHTTKSELVRSMLSKMTVYTGYYTKLLIILYHIIPVYGIIQHYLYTNITVKKQSLIITLICTILLYTNMLHMLFGGLSSYFMLDFNSFPVYEVRNTQYMLMLTMFLFIMTLVFSLLIFFQPFHNFTIISAKTIRRNSNISSSNLRMFLHMQKNLFVAISKFSQMDLDECKENPERACNNLKTIKNLSDNTIDNLAKNLNMLHLPRIMPQKTSVYELIDSVISNIDIPQNIMVDKDYPTEPLYFIADTASLHEAFTNIFSNAIEAIEMAHRPTGRILIQITHDYDLICISISDDGCGIDKKNMKYLFEPLFSTKSTRKNYGLGLSYAKEVVLLHNGYITINSALGTGTKVQIVMPKIRKRLFGKISANQFTGFK